MTVIATVLEWLMAPDVPVTVMLTCEEVGGLLVELLPPHPIAKMETINRTPTRPIHRRFLRAFFLPTPNNIPNTPKPGSRVAIMDVL